MMWFRVWAVSIVLISSFQVINSAFLRCYYGSINNYKEVSLENATDLINTQYLNISLPTFIYTYGYTSKTDGPTTILVMTAYAARTGFNTCLMNWEKEANSGLIPVFSYPVVVQASEDVAQAFATAIQKLSNAGLSLDTLQLTGLSLGAHLFGHAGRSLIALGLTISQITGLDPAYPEYDGLTGVKQPLSKSDAKFVYIIHTDPGQKGMKTPTANIDFFVNYGFYVNGTNRQPGCPSGLFEPLSENDLCSHTRAPALYVECLANPTGFLASVASSYDSWVAADGAPNNATYIGVLTDKKYSGVYYLSTNDQSPYSRGVAGLRP